MPACAPHAAARLAGLRACAQFPRLAGVLCTARTMVCRACGTAVQSLCVYSLHVCSLHMPPPPSRLLGSGAGWQKKRQMLEMHGCRLARFGHVHTSLGGGARRGQSWNFWMMGS